MKILMLLIVCVVPLGAMQKPDARPAAALTPGQRLKIKQFADAVGKGQVEIVETLLRSKLPINIDDIKTSSGSAPLEKAVFEHDARMAEVLLRYGANPNRRVSSGMTPGKTILMHAVANGDAPMVELLIRYGADISAEYTDDIGREGKMMRAINFLRNTDPEADKIRKLLSKSKLP